MRRLILLAVLAAGCSAGSAANREDQPSAAPTARKDDAASDSAALRSTLDAWYGAMQRVDSAGIVAPLTPQFLLLEDTLPLSASQLVARLKGAAAGTTWTYAFSDWRTRVVGDVAWTTLRNHETSPGEGGAQCQADFLETIVFVRQEGRWLIDRYHAAALRRWSCGEGLAPS